MLIFTTLKKTFLILITLIGLNFTSSAQNKATTTDYSNSSVKAKFIKSYPNPATTVVNFEFQKSYNNSYSLQVLNTIGKVMYEAKNIPFLLTIDLKAAKFYRGIYIYQLIDKSGVVIESGKILVVN